MPDIGEGIAEVEIIEWYVKVGDEISADQVVASIQTDKSVVEMPTPLAGTVVALGAQPGQMLPVGDVLLAVESTGEVVAGPLHDAAPAEQAANGRADMPAAPSADTAPEPDGLARRKASPAVRRLAAEHGLALEAVQGTGPEGRITREDVLQAADRALSGREGVPQPAAASGSQAVAPSAAKDVADEHVPLRGLRRQIARNMVESWRTIPHIIDFRDVDASRLVEARNALRDAWPEDARVLTYVPIFVKMTAVALRRHPLMNASFHEDAGEYVLHGHVHIGVATATPDGLLVPVVRDADCKSILALAQEIAGLVELARSRKASLDQLTGGTYTVNNLGALGASMGTPIVRPPEVGITGFGRIADRVVALDGAPAVRPMLTLSCVGDHRIHDGDTLGGFVSTLVRLLEHPYELLGETA